MDAALPSRRARRTAALAYPLGIVSGIVSLVSASDEPFVRFHAWQSILVSVLAVAAIVGLDTVPLVGSALALLVTVLLGLTLLWLALRAWRGHWTRVPLLGDVALERAD